MDLEVAISDLKKYREALNGILSRFERTRDGIHIAEGDDRVLRQIVLELSDLFKEIPTLASYSGLIRHEFNEGISNFFSSPSYKSVENILAAVSAATTQLQRKSGSSISGSTENLNACIHPTILNKCRRLLEAKAYPEAIELSFKIVRDQLRALTTFETASDAFGKGKLHIGGAAAPNVDEDFNHGAKFLMMAIDRFRNEKSHTSEAEVSEWGHACQYLMVSSLALRLLERAECLPAGGCR